MRVFGPQQRQPLPPSLVAFDVYDECAGLDCLASKGIGLVRLATPRGPAYVAFTHMQADDEHWLERKSQYEQAAKLMLGAISPGDPGTPVFMAGDLNTRGSVRGATQTGQAREWHEVHDPASNVGNIAGGFFACGNGVATGTRTLSCQFGANGTRLLTDSWGFETSTTDRGQGPGRLDYILHSSGRLCMQHAMNAWDLQADAYGNGGRMWLSDHFPVRADIGFAARHCSPNDDPAAALAGRNVRDLNFGPTNCTSGGAGPNPPCHQDEVIPPPEAGIGPAGAFQWFRIEQFGSYSIETQHAQGQRVVFDVYHHSDLSRPILPFDTEETR